MKIDSLMQVRNEVLQNRFDPPRGMQTNSVVSYPGFMTGLLKFSNDDPESFTQSTRTQQIALPQGERVRLRSRAAILSGAWDYRQIEFQPEAQHDRLSMERLQSIVAVPRFLPNFLRAFPTN